MALATRTSAPIISPTVIQRSMHIVERRKADHPDNGVAKIDYALTWVSSALACFKSAVLKPSVNQPYTGARRSRASTPLP